MNIKAEIKKTWTEIPVEVQQFLKKAFIIFVIWKLVYGFILFPLRVPDKQLTDLTALTTVVALQNFFYRDNILEVKKVETNIKNHTTYADWILMNNKKIISIADSCNALELYVLYIGFLFCFSVSAKDVFLFIATGLISIYFSNSLRCIGIAVLNIRGNRLTDIAHHYVFKLIVYCIIFFLWFIFIKKKVAI